VGGFSAIIVLGIAEFVRTGPVRGAVRSLTLLVEAANRGDLDGAARLCSSRYLERHPLELAEEAGIRGLPRSIHKNFTAWRQDQNVWICPTNRVGPVYQFQFVGERWRFDGLVGELLPGREFQPTDSEAGGL
jgi:hypothetical protein